MSPSSPVAPLDPSYQPSALWNRSYSQRVNASGRGVPVAIGLERSGGRLSRWSGVIDPKDPESLFFLERTLKFLLWQRGGRRIHIGGAGQIGEQLAAVYSEQGERSFDSDFIGRRVFGFPLQFELTSDADEVPATSEASATLGGHLDGCRIGFDLGGSDRKTAAVIDGEPIFTEEIPWDPYFQEDVSYHLEGVRHSLQRAAEHLPRIDAIGGSAAGIYIDNRVRAGSLFRGVPEDHFADEVENLFLDLQKAWGGVPFEVANDGDVTALAGALSSKTTSLLGIAMGTSEAVGYIDPSGQITGWLNELAFCPVDHREAAPVDEWSGDGGCGAQYFSQQAVARLAPLAGFDLPDDMPFPERLVVMQDKVKAGDPQALQIFDTIGIYLGYSLAHYAEFYEIENLLILGRVTSGEGGERIRSGAESVLAEQFPELAERVSILSASEKDKRHGQAVAAASLPALG